MQPDPKAIWQNQAKEVSPMTMEIIERKARELHAKNARELVKNVASPLAVVVVSGPGIVLTTDGGPRVAFALAIAWSIAGHLLLRRGMLSAIPAADAASMTGVEFYRRELNRRRYFLGRILRYSLGPILLAIGTLILALSGIAHDQGKSLRVLMPFCVGIAAWLVLVFVMKSRSHRDLRREIDELDSIARK
jgi:hypothetical protein